jgi:hypothetical protein
LLLRGLARLEGRGVAPVCGRIPTKSINPAGESKNIPAFQFDSGARQPEAEFIPDSRSSYAPSVHSSHAGAAIGRPVGASGPRTRKGCAVLRHLSESLVLLALFVLVSSGRSAEPAKAPAQEKENDRWTKDFPVEPGELGPTGRNPYFILEPGYFLVYKHGKEELTITVLDETKQVDGVECRVVEERETKDGKVFEVSRNFYAISKRTNSVYYFGEEVDFYEDGKVVNHEGAWLSGVKGARFGLMMPGIVLLGARYYHEVAPGVALDRSEVVSLTETIEVPAGTFKNCVRTEETNPLEPNAKEYKVWAPGIGLLKDDKMELVKFGRKGVK